MCGSVLDAAFNLVHDYPGGARALAPRIGKSPTTLCHELTAQGSAKLGLVDAVKLSALTGSTSVAQAFAQAVGGVFVPGASGAAGLADGDLEAVARTMREVSEAVAVFCDAMADGRVSENELRRLDKEILQGVSCLTALGVRARTEHEAGKPGRLRAVGA